MADQGEITILKRPRAEAAVSGRKFLKKTARGKVIKVIRERYLRDDIGSGSLFDTVSAGPAPVLSAKGITSHQAFSFGHYLIPDTNVFLAQMDLLENPAFKDVVVLQTVLDEVRHRSLPLFSRLKALVADEDRRFYVFYNEFRRDTCTLRKEGESPNDRNDRAIRQAAAWYPPHLSLSQRPSSPAPSVVLLTDDADNRRKAKAQGIAAAGVREYVERMDAAEQLVDLVASPGDDEVSREKKEKRAVYYPEYLPTATLMAGVKAGELHQGHFNANPYNYLEGTARVSAFAKPILLIGRESMNRAIDGDVVVVEVLPEAEWKAPADEVIDADAALRNDDAEADEEERGEGDEAERRAAEREKREAEEVARRNEKERQPTGRVVGVIKRNWRAYVAHLDRTSLTATTSTSLSQQTVFATPLSRSIPKIRIRTRQASSLLSQKILVAIDRWEPTSRYPEGHFVRALGQVESKEAEQESLLLEYDVPYRPFSKAILGCLPKEGDEWKVPPKDYANPAWRDREDLREEVICSIDPPGCQDIDDALHAKLLPNGNIEAGVHIADVSYFVHPDNPMDAEAASRGTTVYLVDKRIDMLPSLLGTNLCSLRPFVERLAFSAIWEMTPDSDIVNVRFTKSVIASKAAFTYEEAQVRKDDPSLSDPITQSIRLLNTLALKLKAKRMAAGALNLASPEVKIHLDSAESAEPIDVEQKELRETNSLVEEFMLLANCSVAQKIYDTFPQTAVLRRHMPPPKTNFETLQDILTKRKGLALDVSSSGALAASLDKCIDAQEPAFNTLVRIMATRCMLSAEYFCSGSVSKEAFGHYGLASPIYTHFTSPIRRYADVLAHRQLAAAISYAPLHASLHNKQFVERIMDNINKRHRLAQMAGRASVEFYVALAIRARNEKAGENAQSVREKAYVIRTFRNGIAVFVSSLGIEGLITFKRSIEFDPEAYEVTIPRPDGQGEVKIGIFDSVTVDILVEKDRSTQRGRVKMVLREPVDSSDL